MDLLSKLGGLNKLEEEPFQRECVPVISQLWPMADRTVRTAMLSSLKTLTDLIPNQIVNKAIFENMLAGFSDSNAK